MNRQERRRLAKIQETKAEYFKELQEQQSKVRKDISMIHMIAYALALHDLGYGDTIIEKVILKANDILSSLDGETVTFWTLADELKRKT